MERDLLGTRRLAVVKDQFEQHQVQSTTPVCAASSLDCLWLLRWLQCPVRAAAPGCCTLVVHKRMIVSGTGAFMRRDSHLRL